MEELRVLERREPDGSFVRVAMKDLKIGDVFRTCEGKLWTAKTNPVPFDSKLMMESLAGNTWAIDAEEIA